MCDRLRIEIGLGILEDWDMAHKELSETAYDKENLKPVIRSCPGTEEKVAGFRDIQTGEFIEVMRIHNGIEMDGFLEKYDISIAELET